MRNYKKTTLLPALVAGLGKRFANGKLTFASGTYAVSDMVTQFQAVTAAFAALAPLEAKWHNAVLAARAAFEQAWPVAKALIAYLHALYGADAEALADFGLTPRKTSKPSVATKAQAQAKAKATREARHTAGKKQKKAIKGQAPEASASASNGTSSAKS